MKDKLFSLGWYFPTFIVEVYKKMNLKTQDPWLTPNEMYQQIECEDFTLYKKIQKFFELYEGWYLDRENDQKKEAAINQRKEIVKCLKKYEGKE